jgi:hypothetical protein
MLVAWWVSWCLPDSAICRSDALQDRKLVLSAALDDSPVARYDTRLLPVPASPDSFLPLRARSCPGILRLIAPIAVLLLLPSLAPIGSRLRKFAISVPALAGLTSPIWPPQYVAPASRWDAVAGVRPVSGQLVQLSEKQYLPLFGQEFYLLIFVFFSGVF